MSNWLFAFRCHNVRCKQRWNVPMGQSRLQARFIQIVTPLWPVRIHASEHVRKRVLEMAMIMRKAQPLYKRTRSCLNNCLETSVSTAWSIHSLTATVSGKSSWHVFPYQVVNNPQHNKQNSCNTSVLSYLKVPHFPKNVALGNNEMRERGRHIKVLEKNSKSGRACKDVRHSFHYYH